VGKVARDCEKLRKERDAAEKGETWLGKRGAAKAEESWKVHNTFRSLRELESGTEFGGKRDYLVSGCTIIKRT